jgi:hypothetical protein
LDADSRPSNGSSGVATQAFCQPGALSRQFHPGRILINHIFIFGKGLAVAFWSYTFGREGASY